MKNYLKRIAFPMLFLIIGALVLFTTTTPAMFGISATPKQKEPQKIDCEGDLQLARAAKELHGNKAALAILKANCLILFGNFVDDLENNGTHNLVFWGSGVDCGSCHIQILYILDSEGKIIFEKEVDDPQIKTEILHNKQRFLLVTEPVRKNNETLSNPSEFTKIGYKWNPWSEKFEKSNLEQDKITPTVFYSI